MLPERDKMIRDADVFVAVYAISPAVYILIATLAVFGKQGLTRNPDVIFPLFLSLVAVSVAETGIIFFTQTNRVFLEKMARMNPLRWPTIVMSLGFVLSHSMSIWGLLLTLLSGSIAYGIGFSIVSWAFLPWLRTKFRQNVGKIS